MTEEQYNAVVAELQKKIIREAREAYGDKGLERWQNPQFNGRLYAPDGYGKITGKL